MLCVETVQGKMISPIELSLRALINVPKVFLSVMFVVMAFFVLLLYAPPLSVFALFLVWAPAFAAAEVYAPLPERKIEDEFTGEEEGEDYIVPSRRAGRASAKFAYFTGRSIWDLGVMRSIRFARENLATSLRIVLLVWFARVAPEALSSFIIGLDSGFLAVSFRAIFATLIHTFALGVWAGTFIIFLPMVAKAEIGVESYRDPVEFIGGRRFLAPILGDRNLPFAVFAIFAAIFTWVLFEEGAHQLSVPKDAKIEFVSSEVRGENLALTIRLEDSAREFRWLDPDSFVVLLRGLEEESPAAGKVAVAPVVTSSTNPSASGVKEGAEEGNKTSAGDKVLKGEEGPSILRPKRSRVYLEDGKELDAENFTPAFKPLKITLFFELPEVLTKSQKVGLSYQSIKGLSKPLFTFELVPALPVP